MSILDIRRQMKNLTMSTIVQTKVREATNNSVLYPPIKLLTEIAYMTYSPAYIDKIMKIVLKRLNDEKRKNWRHVLKGLILVEFLLKNGSVKVAEMCHDNIYLICMLQTYESAGSSLDNGMMIRGKADIVFQLLHEPELLAQQREMTAQKRHAAEAKFNAKKQQIAVDDLNMSPRGVPKADSLPESQDVPRPPLITSTSLDKPNPPNHYPVENPNFTPTINKKQYFKQMAKFGISDGY
ncbi:ENTH domain-containing protein [Aphelenchoides bicaudatus]|nr:ENTH domain-containing protein [Aphelenchoides bicaudatus]